MELKDYKPKSFWKKPEGVLGAVVLAGMIGVVGFGLTVLPWALIFESVLWSVITLVIVVTALYVLIDPKMRNLVWYMYRNTMRWITGLFVQVDPIGILKGYIADLEQNIRNMSRQIAKLRGQMHKLKEVIVNNQRDIQTNLEYASKAKANENRAQMILKSRKAGRLKESNLKLDQLYTKMEVMYRVLTKMHENSTILAEDVKDQVEVKEQERKAITASHSAMQSAMNVINGDKDKKELFDRALEAIADDVSHKVGEMERFMELSANFMESIDLQNGVFEEEGLEMLEMWEKEGVSRLLGEEKEHLIEQAKDDGDILDLNEQPQRQKVEHTNQYDSLFD